MSKRFLLALGAALIASTLGSGAFAETPTGSPGATDPLNGTDAGHHHMMGGMHGMHSTDMTRMMENCNRMMQGMRQPDGSQKPQGG